MNLIAQVSQILSGCVFLTCSPGKVMIGEQELNSLTGILLSTSA